MVSAHLAHLLPPFVPLLLLPFLLLLFFHSLLNGICFNEKSQNLQYNWERFCSGLKCLWGNDQETLLTHFPQVTHTHDICFFQLMLGLKSLHIFDSCSLTNRRAGRVSPLSLRVNCIRWQEQIEHNRRARIKAVFGMFGMLQPFISYPPYQKRDRWFDISVNQKSEKVLNKVLIFFLHAQVVLYTTTPKTIAPRTAIHYALV